MSPTPSSHTSTSGEMPISPKQELGPDEPRPHETRNFWTLVVYNIVMRTGWIFKTESSIMPAVLDSLSESGWVRGSLPLLNRFGQSVPPLLMARTIAKLRKKKRAFVLTTSSMALIFGGLAAIWLVPGLASSPLAAFLFLLLYAMFFMVIGVNQLTYNTLQGKLIRATRRGRLLMLADTVGATSAVVCAVVLLSQWLTPDKVDAVRIFGFSAFLFSFSTITAMLLKETPDTVDLPPQAWHEPFWHAMQLLRSDVRLRRVGLVAALFSTSLVLFPHYQNLAKNQLGLNSSYLVLWVVAQNIGTALFSIVTGPLSDRFGNRLSLRILTLAICSAPQLALWMEAHPPEELRWFAMVFLLVGMTPVTQKTLYNYTLEIAARVDQPKYLSTLNLCMGAPILFSPLVGMAIDAFGHTAIYHAVTVVLALGALACWRLDEPRFQSHEAAKF